MANISKIKREALLKSIQDINRAVLNDYPELADKLREIYSEIEDKKYGLVFEEHEEKIDRILQDNIAVLEEAETKK